MAINHGAAVHDVDFGGEVQENLPTAGSKGGEERRCFPDVLDAQVPSHRQAR